MQLLQDYIGVIGSHHKVEALLFVSILHNLPLIYDALQLHQLYHFSNLELQYMGNRIFVTEEFYDHNQSIEPQLG